MGRFIGFLALVLVAFPAWAGSLATYRNAADGSTLKIEMSDQGTRLEYSNQPFTMILKSNEAYIAYPTSPPVVLNVADIQKVFEEFRPVIKFEHDGIDRVKIVGRGRTTVGGYSGRAFYIQTPYGTSTKPTLVVSDDPKFKAIGDILRRQFDFSIVSVRLSGQQVPPNLLLLRKYIGDGTPLAFAGYRLESIKPFYVDAARLELPADPMPIEQMRRNAESTLKRQ